MNRKPIHIAVLSTALLMASCSKPAASSGSSSSIGSESSGYDSSWTPGSSALPGAHQPTVKHPKGNYNALGKMRESQGKKGLPQSGQANLLVVPVRFQGDEELGIEYTSIDRDSLRSAYFGEEAEGNAMPSVAKYYETSSYGKLHLSGVVSPILTLPKNVNSYLSQTLSYGLESTVKSITDYVYEYLFKETQSYYEKDFDSDDDGKIDGIVLAYGWQTALAYYQTSIYSSLARFLTNDTMFDSEIGNESPVSSITWTSGLISDMTNIDDDSHVYINEVGKMIGLEDYSDLTGTADGYYRAPLAHKDMMDGSIGDHNPFSKLQLGWIEPKLVKSSSVEEDTKITLDAFEETGDCLILSPKDTGIYGEYLMVEYYSGEGLNKPDANRYYPYNLYGNYTYNVPGIRVYKVNSRIVEGTSSSNVSLTSAEPDFEKTYTLSNGKKVKAYYDFAYGNSGVNEYTSSGVFEDYALVSELSKNGFNRHMVDDSYGLEESDLFLKGDEFGGEDSVTGFYRDFAFDNGKKLGLTFTVNNISEEAATITLRRAK